LKDELERDKNTSANVRSQIHAYLKKGDFEKTRELKNQLNKLETKILAKWDEAERAKESLQGYFSRCAKYIKKGRLEELQCKDMEDFDPKPDWEIWLNDPDYILAGPMTRYESYLAEQETFRDPVKSLGPRGNLEE